MSETKCLCFIFFQFYDTRIFIPVFQIPSSMFFLKYYFGFFEKAVDEDVIVSCVVYKRRNYETEGRKNTTFQSVYKFWSLSERKGINPSTPTEINTEPFIMSCYRSKRSS